MKAARAITQALGSHHTDNAMASTLEALSDNVDYALRKSAIKTKLEKPYTGINEVSTMLWRKLRLKL